MGRLVKTMEQGGFTDSKGRALNTYRWVPGEGEVTGLVFLCHGYAERLVPYYSQIAEEGSKVGLLCLVMIMWVTVRVRGRGCRWETWQSTWTL